MRAPRLKSKQAVQHTKGTGTDYPAFSLLCTLPSYVNLHTVVSIQRSFCGCSVRAAASASLGDVAGVGCGLFIVSPGAAIACPLTAGGGP